MTKTVIEHVLSRLRDIGVTDVFGVPGDYAFTINDAICNDREIRWVGWWCAQSDTNRSPSPKSLLSGNLTGNSPILGATGANSSQ